MKALPWLKSVVIVAFLGAVSTLSAGEIWIVQSSSGSTPGGTGTQANPYTVPVGNTSAFDTIIGSLPVKTAVHLGAGTFLTQGTDSSAAVIVNDGCSIEGSGMGITTIKVADNAWTSGQGSALELNPSSHAAGYHAAVKNLTVDVNFANQGGSVTTSVGIGAHGHSILIEAVEIINIGSRSAEAFGVFAGNIEETDLDKPSHIIIRNSKVHKPWTGTTDGLSAFHPTGNNVWSGVVEGCYVDLSEIPGVYSAAFAFAGAPQGLVIAHNTAIGAHRGVHIDTPGEEPPAAARNAVIIANKIYNCVQGIGIGTDNYNDSGTYSFENFTIEANAIEMLRGGLGIALWGNTKGFLVTNNTILKHPDASPSTHRKGIYVSPGAESHRVVGNRFGPSGDPYFEDIEPVYYTQDAAKKNHFEDNTWTTDKVLPKLFTSLRLGTGQPAGTNLWEFFLGAAESDANPTTQLRSSDLDGSNAYTYFRFSRAPGGYTSGYNTVFDPAGNSGVYIGDNDSGALGVGGWITAHTGVFLDTAAKLKISEGGGRMGTVTLVAGQATVSTTQVAANSRIFLTQQQDGGTPGAVRVSSRSAGTSFVIKSTSASDTSVVAWLIVDP